MLTFSQAGDRLHQAAVKIQLERGISYGEAFKYACSQDTEASLYYFETPRTREKYLETPQQAEARKKEEALRQKQWQFASTRLTQIANQYVASGTAKDFNEGFKQAREAHPELAYAYDGK